MRQEINNIYFNQKNVKRHFLASSIVTQRIGKNAQNMLLKNKNEWKINSIVYDIDGNTSDSEFLNQEFLEYDLLKFIIF